MKHQFKVGDRVRIRSWENMKKEFGLNSTGSVKCMYSYTSEMKPLCGKIAKITEINARSKDIRLSNFEDCRGLDTHWCYSTDMIEPVTFGKVVILRDGADTKAVLYKDGEITETATARCNASDTYDFKTGASLALNRLFEDKPEFTDEDKAAMRTFVACGYYFIGRDGDGSNDCCVSATKCERFKHDYWKRTPYSRRLENYPHLSTLKWKHDMIDMREYV